MEFSMKIVYALLRLLANHCIEPHLRLFLFKCSGIKIGKGAYINMNFNAIDSYKKNTIIIKNLVAISPNVSIITSSSPNNSHIKQFNVSKEGKVVIKKGAWIGTGAVILPGVIIGEGAIIGANAVVTRNVDDYSIMVGIPAKKIGDVRNTTKYK